MATWLHLKSLIAAQYRSTPHEISSASNYSIDNSGHFQGSTNIYIPWARERLMNMGIGIDFIRREIVPPDGEFMETVQRSVGPMKRLYTRLEFTPSVDAQLKAAWVKSEQGSRVAAMGITGGLALALVGLVYGLLQVDTWTKGYYSKRLFLGVPALIILIAVVFLAFVSYL
jgi:hypothetical protein